MSVLNIPEQTTENLYQSQRELAQKEYTAKYRLQNRFLEPEPEQPELETPGVVEGFKNVLKDLSANSAADAAWGFLSSATGDTFKGLRQVLSPGEAASNVILSGGDVSEFGRTMGEVFRGEGAEEESTAAMDFAKRFTDDPTNQLALAATAQVLTDPMTYVPVIGQVSAARKAYAAKKLASTTMQGQKMSTIAHTIAPGNDELLRLAKQAEGGSKRAVKKFASVLSSESAGPLIKQMEESTLKRDWNRIFSVGGQGKTMPKTERRAQAVLSYHRREGNPELLADELVNGPKPAKFKHSESYLKMNSPDDIQSFQNVYLQETQRYVNNTLEKSKGMQKLALQEELLKQPGLLKRQIGDNIPTDISPVDAFAQRRLLSDLASTALRQVHRSEMKFRSNVDYLRFWKLVSARESIRTNLSGSVQNEVPAFMSMLSTEAEGMAARIFKVDRAILKLPEIDPRLERQIARSLAVMDANQAEMFFNGLFPIAGLDKRMHKLWLNSLLSSPITHSRNIVSNFGVALMKPLHEMGAAPLSLAQGNTSEAMIHLRRARELTLGMADVMLDSFRIMSRNPTPTAKNMQMFRNMHEASVTRPRLSKEALQNASVATRALDVLASYMPTEMLGKTDTWFKSLTYRADIRANAVEMASRMTNDPQTRRQLTKQLINDPLELAKGEALKSAEVATFQNPLPIQMAKAINIARRFSGTKWIVPFIQTPANIAVMGIKHTPFAPMLKSVRDDIAAGGAARDMALAKIAVTQGIGLSGVMMLDDRVTGSDNQRLRLNEMPAYSIRVGDKWYSYQYIEPLRWILGPMADLRDMAMSTDWDARGGPEKFEIAVSGFVGAYYKAVMDNYFAFQLARVMDSVRRGLEDGVWSGLIGAGSQVLQGFAPAGGAWLNRTFIDQNVRELDTFNSRLMNRIPGLSLALPPKVGLLGEPQIHATQLLGLLPADINQASKHPLYAHIQITGAKVPDVAKSLRGVELNATQRAQLRMFRANPVGTIPLADASEQLIGSPSYRQAGPEGRAEYIQNLILKYNELANRQLWNEDGQLRQSAIDVDNLEKRLRGQR